LEIKPKSFISKFIFAVNDFFWTSKCEPTVVKQDHSEMLQMYAHQINAKRNMSRHIPI